MARTAPQGISLAGAMGGMTAASAAQDGGDAELRSRVYFGLWIAVIAIALFAVGDTLFAAAHLRVLYPIKAVYLATILLAFRALRTAADAAAVTRIALVIIAVSFAVSSVSATVAGDPLTTPVLCSAVTLGSAALIPWTVRAQCITVAIAVLALMATTLAMHGTLAPLADYPTLVVGACFGLSILLAQRIGEYRAVAADAERRLRDEAQVSAALARVGQALIASLDTGELLERLSQLTAEVFGSNASHTWLREPDDTYRLVTGTSDLPEEQEALRALALPGAAVGGLISRLDRDGPLVLDGALLDALPTGRLSRANRVTHVLFLPIRKGGEMVGVQSATFRDRREPLPPWTAHLAAGIAQLASLALETTRLVEALNDADRLKTDFLANLSHELRTPLNVIIGYNEMLLDGACGPLDGEQATVLGRAQHNARELLALMGAALELSRHQGRALPLNLGPVSVAAVLAELADEVAALPLLPGVAVEWSVPSPPPRLVTDPLKLRMVLKNLIDNARKFTTEGTITVAVAERGDGVEFAVHDTGRGIPTEDLPLIFEPFRQIAGLETPSGVGLGLFLVRRLVEAMDGRVSAESRVGQGSTFRVWLPGRDG